jgi:deazaflavin-dependent oxidoreductase (nitroreductase family)
MGWRLHRWLYRLSGGRLGSRLAPVTARELEGADRDRMWARVVETDPSYAEYQRRTTRRIPVVVLERIADA